jgi:hypothetical protein
MRFDVCAAAPFDARRVRCQVMRFDVCVFITAVPITKLFAWKTLCTARRSMPCEGSDEVSIGDQQC